jgi:hypothetical protein
VTDIITPEEVAEYALGNGVDMAQDFVLLEWARNTAVQAAQQHCRRTFELAGTTATARVFAPSSPGLCPIDDVHDLTDFVVRTDSNDSGTFSTTFSANDYELSPLNATPYTRLRAVGTLSFPMATLREGVVQVTARWGWPAVPPMVKQACLELAKDAYRAHSATSGVLVDAGTGAMFSARTNRMASAWLAPFVRHDQAGMG